ncbi:MAG: hypothetical protein ACRDK1_08295 [Solirubrobacterales bacterium]
MRTRIPTRGWLTLALAAVCGLVGTTPAAMAAKRPHTVKPGKHPAQVDARHLPVRGGAPSPEGLGYAPVGDRCRGRAQPGTISLRRYIDHWFHGHSLGIYNCRNVAGTNHLSTHAEGRALDWALDATVPNQRREAHRIIHYFLRKDSLGKPRAMARRWGIEVIIYDEHIWSVIHDHEGWRPCEDSCSDHIDHLHIEQNWRGAKRTLSAWNGWAYRASGI